MHHRIASVQPLPDARLQVTFIDGTVKYFDFNLLDRKFTENNRLSQCLC